VSVTEAPRPRMSAPARRDALIDAAIWEFAVGGLHGTPVSRVAQRAGVTQPYIFSLFTKRELFIAATERGFERVGEIVAAAAADFRAPGAESESELVAELCRGYAELLRSDRALLMLQHHAYAACGDPAIGASVRRAHGRLVTRVKRLNPVLGERIGEFVRYAMWINVTAMIGGEEPSA
jgi:AcrR family transcriptional regulator